MDTLTRLDLVSLDRATLSRKGRGCTVAVDIA